MGTGCGTQSVPAWVASRIRETDITQLEKEIMVLTFHQPCEVPVLLAIEQRKTVQNLEMSKLMTPGSLRIHSLARSIT